MFRYINIHRVKIPELEQVLNIENGAGWSMLWHIFFYTRMLKYVHKKQFKDIQDTFKKITTKKNLNILCELKYLCEVQPGIFIATNKVIPILKQAGFPIHILPPQSKGKGKINEMNNTEVLIQATHLKHFQALIYYNFVYLRPDALLVLYNREEQKYKLTFLEIEAQKPKWEEYIDEKKKKYLELAKDDLFYNFIKETLPKIGIPAPHSHHLLKFSVTFVGSICRKDFGHGFSFVRSLTTTT